LPLVESELKRAAGAEPEPEQSKDVSTKAIVEKSARLVTSDGTYATQSAFSMNQTKSKVNFFSAQS